MQTKVKFSWGYYFEPTPRRLKSFGAGISAMGAAVSTSGIVTSLASEEKNEFALWLTLGSVIVTALGQFMFEFFKEEEEEAKRRPEEPPSVQVTIDNKTE
jgi:hypothetical protein